MGPNPEVSPVAGPIEVTLAVVMIAVCCYVGLAWALCYIRLGIVRGTGAIRAVPRRAELAEPA